MSNESDGFYREFHPLNLLHFNGMGQDKSCSHSFVNRDCYSLS